MSTGPGPNALAHFDTAFFWAERCKNRMVNPRLHDGKEVSAEMQFFNNEYSGLGCFYVYWMPVMALVHPEIRDNKFVQHAKPAVYVGPSREVESDGFGLFWNGTRHFTTSLGCVRGDDRAIIAKSSRTNPEVQPFTTNPDSPAPMPSFDSWIDLTFEKPGTETTPSSIDDSAVFHSRLSQKLDKSPGQQTVSQR